MQRILIATSNPGKLRDFAGAAASHGITIAAIPDFASLPLVVEDGQTFEENARKKAEQYSQHAPGEIVVADDSGLEVDALGGAPGVHSARYAADQPHLADENTDDEANNARVLRELRKVPPEKRTGRFVCVLAAARDGQTLAIFRGTAEGVILDAPRGTNGFGYDPLFYFPQIQKTFAELSAEEKAQYSHRGAAFRQLLEWCETQTTEKIDRVILSVVRERWTKVAMVIAKVVDAMSLDLPDGGESCEVVFRRIEALVHSGRLAAQGNIRNSRFSEVRRGATDH